MNHLEQEKRSLQDKVDAKFAQPSMTATERKQVDVWLSRIADIRAQESRQQRLATAMAEVGMPVSDEQREERENSFNIRSYLARGSEARTYSGMNIATDSNGGFLVPQTFYSKVTAALKQADSLWDDSVITMYEDTHGSQLICPLLDDVSVSAAQIVSENILSNESEIAIIDRTVLGKVPTWRSLKLIVSMELLQDSAFPVESLAATAIAGRFQRGIDSANVSTLISSITSGATSGSSGTVSIDDTLNLLSSVNPAYLTQPKTFFAMNFSTLVTLLKQKDSQGRYQWHPRTDANGRLLLHNIPVVIMPSLPSAASNAVGTVVLGDFSRTIRRVVKDSLKIQRYEQAPSLAENGLVAYEGFIRSSFGVLASSSSDSPIKYLTQAS